MGLGTLVKDELPTEMFAPQRCSDLVKQQISRENRKKLLSLITCFGCENWLWSSSVGKK